MNFRATRRGFLQRAACMGLVSFLPLRAEENISGANSLRAYADARGLLIGCAVAPEKLRDEAQYAHTVAEQENLLVAENAMKWHAVHPAPDKYDFAPADSILAFADAHRQRVRGHNLCWHEGLPDWFQSIVTKNNARQILTEHIRAVAGHFAGKLHSWDVVNEALNLKDGRPDGLRKSPWLELAGPDYIDLAFHTAREADPRAQLAYNDYGIELDYPEDALKREKLLDMVRGMKKRNVPIDAVGIQSHLTAGVKAPVDGLREFVRKLHDMGLQVFITELDISDHKVQGTMAERDAAVAHLYGDYLRTMLAEPNVTAVLTGGITGKYTWLNHQNPRSDGQPQRCLPFDAEYKPTPAFFAVRNALTGASQHLL